ncbi:MAG: HNH endonuclease signature motif containing protein [Ruminococcus sp.]
MDRQPGKRVTITCNYCKNDFELLESQKRKREKRGHIVKYCSQKCSGLASRKHQKIAKKCKTCGKETFKKTFCSRECVRFKSKIPPRKRNGYWYENGYKVLYVEGDKSIKEHIKVMEDYIGRKLTEDEVVHHINENRLDNRIENLQLMTRGEHSSYHRKKEIAEGKRLFGR